MNRRGFLQFVGGAALALVASRPVRLLAAPSRPPAWPLEGERCTPEGLRAAIERLFPAGAQHSFKAYEEFQVGRSTPIEGTADGDVNVFAPVQRVVHKTFALGYFVQPDSRQNDKLHRALYRAMYQTWAVIAERPENQGAVLIWRITPVETTNKRFEDNRDVVQLRIRAGLRQRGWRERCEVPTWLEGCIKPEGAPAELLS